jgi:O-antigen/teichoic acid export membrane protein
MKLPSLMVLGSAVCQIILGGTLGLGLGPIPQFGMRGVAAGSLIAFTISTAIMAWYVLSGRARINFVIKGLRIQRGMFFDILKVGAVACFSPLQSVLTVTIFTRMLADFGTEVLAGYGIGARLEFMLTSIAFAVGIASVPMVGMAIGAGRVARARRIAWIAGLVSFVSVGLIATIIAIFPDLWVKLFTDDAGVRAASRQYLHTAAPMYAFIGLSISMYFSSQGAAKVVGPVLAQTARLLFVGLGGWWLLRHEATAANFFALAAASMVVLGTLSALSVMLTRWGPKPRRFRKSARRCPEPSFRVRAKARARNDVDISGGVAPEILLHRQRAQIHLAVDVRRDLIRQYVGDPHHAAAALAVGEDLDRRAVLLHPRADDGVDQPLARIVHGDQQFLRDIAIGESDGARIAVELAVGDEAWRHALMHRAVIAHRRPDVVGTGVQRNVLVDGSHGYSPCMKGDAR